MNITDLQEKVNYLHVNSDQFDIEKTYFYYDGPKLYTTYDHYYKEYYLVSCVNETDEDIKYLHTPITPEQIKQLENNEVSLRDAHKEAFSDYSFLLIYGDKNKLTVKLIKGADVPDDYLADEGIYLSK